MTVIRSRASSIAIAGDRLSFSDMAAANEGEVDIELVVVTMRFDAAEPASLMAVLAKYVVLTRMQPGCRNVDLVASITHPDRVLVVQKWDSPSAQRAHFDSEVMVDMAKSCAGLLTQAPDIDLWESISAHDLA
jgi:quinol monooxygenase YgiN